MISRHDSPLVELRQIEVANVARSAMIHGKVEHLVEVTVIQGAIPSDGQGIAAHDTCSRGWVEGIGQPLHIPLVISALDEELQEPANRHVGDREQPVEDDAVAARQFAPELRFDRLLLRWKKCADGIVGKIKERHGVYASSVGFSIPTPNSDEEQRLKYMLAELQRS